MDLLDLPGGARAHADTGLAGDAGSTPLQRCVTQMLDEVDYGMLLILDERRVEHMNHAARMELDADHPLQLLGNELRVRHTHDLVPLREALADAGRRGRRRLLTVGEGPRRLVMSVVPLAVADGPSATLLLFGRRHACEELTLHGFARLHGLTPAETEVLKQLCAGERPERIAERQGVAISTVRTQIGSVRTKTGSDSIRALIQRVALLPPLVTALRTRMH